MAVVVLVLATGLVVGVLMSGGSGTSNSGLPTSGHGASRSPSGTTAKRTAVDLAATPKGWVPFAYEDAQVSVPASWAVEGTNCGSNNPKQGVIFLGGCSVGDGGCPPGCANTEPDNWIQFSSLPYPPASYRGQPSYPVNGYAVYESSGCDHQCLSVYDVPSLGVELTGAGPTFPKVLHTLSSSPRSVALATGPAPAVPPAWRHVSFGGLNVAVPKSWPVERASFYDDCWLLDDLSRNSAVVLNSGTKGEELYSTACENEPDMQAFGFAAPIISAPNGLVIDPGGYRREGTTGSCSTINGVLACVVTSDPYGVLTLSVQVPGRVYPTAVEIGLAGSGQVARTIFYSMRKA